MVREINKLKKFIVEKRSGHPRTRSFCKDINEKFYCHRRCINNVACSPENYSLEVIYNSLNIIREEERKRREEKRKREKEYYEYCKNIRELCIEE